MTDFTINNQGTVVLFTPVSMAAIEKSDELELADWQYIGKYATAFAIDHRPAQHLVDQLQEEGFTFEHDLLTIPAFLRRQ